MRWALQFVPDWFVIRQWMWYGDYYDDDGDQ